MLEPGAPRHWIDGRLVAGQAPLPPTVAGVFETVRCERGRLFFVREHLERMQRGARALGLPWPPPRDPRAALAELALAAQLEEAALRILWAPPALVVSARALAPLPDGLVALVGEPGEVALPRPAGVKTTQRAAYDELRARARATSAWEALVREPSGGLVEGTASNLFLVVGRDLLTPPLGTGALPGIVRAAVLGELARSPLRDERGQAWPARERALSAGDLARAGEVLLTNSIVRVAALDALRRADGSRAHLPGRRGPVFRALRERVLALEVRAGWRAGT